MSVNRVEALKKVYYNLSQQNSNGNTVAEVLQDIYAALSEETTKQSNVTHLIDMISEYAEGGGGGGGDLSTTTVTIAGSQASVKMVIPNEEVGLVWQEGIEAGVYEVPTYKGKALAELDTVSPESVTVSGSCTKQNEFVFITGDCTITFS